MQVVDMLTAPEFFVTRIGRIEQVAGGCSRIYLCVEKDGALVVQVMIVSPVACLAGIGRDFIRVDAEARSGITLVQ